MNILLVQRPKFLSKPAACTVLKDPLLHWHRSCGGELCVHGTPSPEKVDQIFAICSLLTVKWFNRWNQALQNTNPLWTPHLKKEGLVRKYCRKPLLKINFVKNIFPPTGCFLWKFSIGKMVIFLSNKKECIGLWWFFLKKCWCVSELLQISVKGKINF